MSIGPLVGSCSLRSELFSDLTCPDAPSVVTSNNQLTWYEWLAIALAIVFFLWIVAILLWYFCIKKVRLLQWNDCIGFWLVCTAKLTIFSHYGNL